jgi:hypothetical protein
MEHWVFHALHDPEKGHLITLPLFTVVIGVLAPNSTPTYTQTLAQPAHSNPEDGVSMYFGNISNTAHIHNVQRPKSRINIKSEPSWKTKIFSEMLNTVVLFRQRLWVVLMHGNSNTVSLSEIHWRKQPHVQNILESAKTMCSFYK